MNTYVCVRIQKPFTALYLLALLPGLLSAASYPAPSDTVRPNPEPALPSHFDAYNPPLAGVPAAGAPAFAEWVRQAEPGDTLLATGDKLGLFTAYGQGKGAGQEAQAATVFQDALQSQLSLPSSLPAEGMVLLWSSNASGFGRPAAINRTEAWWLQDTAMPGETAAVFGRNFFYGGVTPAVYVMQGGSGSYAQLQSWNNYRIEYRVPASLPLNQSAQVWVHNGHGGTYGWSGPLSLDVRVTANNAAAFWTGRTFNVKDYGAKGDGASDDGAAIAAAMNAAAASRAATGPATVYLPAGTYMTTRGFNNPARVRWMGAGKAATAIKLAPGFSSLALFYESNGTPGAADHVEIRDMTLDINNNLRSNEAYIHGYKLMLETSVNYFKLSNLRIYSGMWVSGAQSGHGETIIFKGVPPGSHAWIEDCDIYGGQLGLHAQSQMFIRNCNFYGQYDAGTFCSSIAGIGVSMTNCRAQDFNPGGDPNASPNPHFADGRLWLAGGGEGTRHVYIADNTTTSYAPRLSANHSNNSGEQILWESGHSHPGFNGKPSSAGAATITIPRNSTNFGPESDGRVYYYVVVMGGKGLGQHRLVSADNGSGTLSVSPAWNVVPDAGSTIQVQTLNERAAVYRNRLDGKAEYRTSGASSSGVQPYGNSFHFEVDSNTITRTNHGLFAWALQDNPNTQAPSYFLLFKNNSVANSNIGGRVLHNNFHGGFVPGTTLLGISFRKNRIDNTALGMMSTGFTVGISDSTMQADRITSTLIERNIGSFLSAASGAPMPTDSRITHTFISGNSFFSGLAPTSSPTPLLTATLGLPSATPTPTRTPPSQTQPKPTFTGTPQPPATYVLGGVTYQVAPGTLFYSTLDGNLRDLSGRGNDLSPSGSLAYAPGGPAGASSALAGFSEASFASGGPALAGLLGGLNSFSLEFFVRGLGAARCSTLLFFGAGASDHWRVDPCIPNYSNFFFTRVQAGLSRQANAQLAGNYQADRWYFMTLVYDFSLQQLRAYADGQLLATASTLGHAMFPGATQFLLGKGLPGSQAASNLQVSQLRILSLAKADGSRTMDLVFTPATATPSATRSATRTATATVTTTVTATFTATVTATPTASSSSTPSATPSQSATASDTPSGTPSETCSETPSETPSATPSSTPSGTATVTPQDSATASPTASPSALPSPSHTPHSPMPQPRPRYVLGGRTYEVAPGTVFYSTLDGNFQDLSGNSFHLEAQGSPAFVPGAPGDFTGSAGGFSPANYFQGSSGLASRLKGLGSFSLEFYVRGLGTARCSTLLYFGGGAGNQWYVNPCIPQYSNFYFAMDRGAFRQANGRMEGNYLAERWYHMVLSYQEAGGTLRVFADGALLGSAGGASAPPWTGEPAFRLGRGLDNRAAENLNISQLRILDYAKLEGSATQDLLVQDGGQFARLRLETKASPQPGLLAGRALLAYPNPAGAKAVAAYALKEAGKARLVLAGLDGSQVRAWELGERPAGESRAELGLEGLASGLYLLRLESDEGLGWRGRGLFKLAAMK